MISVKYLYHLYCYIHNIQVTPSNKSLNASITPGLNNSTSEEISTLKKNPSSHLKERSPINDCNTSLEELNIKSFAPLKKPANITLEALTNNEKVDEIPEIESITQPSQQDETNTESKIKEANFLEKECDEPKICSNLTNSVHHTTPQEVKEEIKIRGTIFEDLKRDI